MRLLAAALVLAAVATPAVAQTLFELEDLRAQQEANARRAVAVANELAALESRLRTEQAIAELRIQREGVRVPELRYAATATRTSPSGVSPKVPSIPDDALADSNRRVQAASQPRR